MCQVIIIHLPTLDPPLQTHFSICPAARGGEGYRDPYTFGVPAVINKKTKVVGGFFFLFLLSLTRAYIYICHQWTGRFVSLDSKKKNTNNNNFNK